MSVYVGVGIDHSHFSLQVKDHDQSDPPLARMPSEAADAEAPGQARIANHYANASQDALAREREHADDEDTGSVSHSRNTPLPPESPTPVNGNGNGKEKEKEKDKEKKPAAKGPKPFDQAEREEMENLLHELRGHLGTWCLTVFRGHAC